MAGGRRDQEWSGPSEKDRYDRYESYPPKADAGEDPGGGGRAEHGMMHPENGPPPSASPRRSFSTASGYVVEVSDRGNPARNLSRDIRAVGGNPPQRRMDYLDWNHPSHPSHPSHARLISPGRDRDRHLRRIRRHSPVPQGRGFGRAGPVDRDGGGRDMMDGPRRGSGRRGDDYRPPNMSLDRPKVPFRRGSIDEDEFGRSSRPHFRTNRDFVDRRHHDGPPLQSDDNLRNPRGLIMPRGGKHKWPGSSSVKADHSNERPYPSPSLEGPKFGKIDSEMKRDRAALESPAVGEPNPRLLPPTRHQQWKGRDPDDAAHPPGESNAELDGGKGPSTKFRGSEERSSQSQERATQSLKEVVAPKAGSDMVEQEQQTRAQSSAVGAVAPENSAENSAKKRKIGPDSTFAAAQHVPHGDALQRTSIAEKGRNRNSEAETRGASVASAARGEHVSRKTDQSGDNLSQQEPIGARGSSRSESRSGDAAVRSNSSSAGSGPIASGGTAAAPEQGSSAVKEQSFARMDDGRPQSTEGQKYGAKAEPGKASRKSSVQRGVSESTKPSESGKGAAKAMEGASSPEARAEMRDFDPEISAAIALPKRETHKAETEGIKTESTTKPQKLSSRDADGSHKEARPSSKPEREGPERPSQAEAGADSSSALKATLGKTGTRDSGAKELAPQRESRAVQPAAESSTDTRESQQAIPVVQEAVASTESGITGSTVRRPVTDAANDGKLENLVQRSSPALKGRSATDERSEKRADLKAADTMLPGVEQRAPRKSEAASESVPSTGTHSKEKVEGGGSSIGGRRKASEEARAGSGTSARVIGSPGSARPKRGDAEGSDSGKPAPQPAGGKRTSEIDESLPSGQVAASEQPIPAAMRSSEDGDGSFVQSGDHSYPKKVQHEPRQDKAESHRQLKTSTKGEKWSTSVPSAPDEAAVSAPETKEKPSAVEEQPSAATVQKRKASNAFEEVWSGLASATDKQLAGDSQHLAREDELPAPSKKGRLGEKASTGLTGPTRKTEFRGSEDGGDDDHQMGAVSDEVVESGVINTHRTSSSDTGTKQVSPPSDSTEPQLSERKPAGSIGRPRSHGQLDDAQSANMHQGGIGQPWKSSSNGSASAKQGPMQQPIYPHGQHVQPHPGMGPHSGMYGTRHGRGSYGMGAANIIRAPNGGHMPQGTNLSGRGNAVIQNPVHVNPGGGMVLGVAPVTGSSRGALPSGGPRLQHAGNSRSTLPHVQHRMVTQNNRHATLNHSQRPTLSPHVHARGAPSGPTSGPPQRGAFSPPSGHVGANLKPGYGSSSGPGGRRPAGSPTLTSPSRKFTAGPQTFAGASTADVADTRSPALARGDVMGASMPPIEAQYQRKPEPEGAKESGSSQRSIGSGQDGDGSARRGTKPIFSKDRDEASTWESAPKEPSCSLKVPDTGAPLESGVRDSTQTGDQTAAEEPPVTEAIPAEVAVSRSFGKGGEPQAMQAHADVPQTDKSTQRAVNADSHSAVHGGVTQVAEDSTELPVRPDEQRERGHEVPMDVEMEVEEFSQEQILAEIEKVDLQLSVLKKQISAAKQAEKGDKMEQLEKLEKGGKVEQLEKLEKGDKVEQLEKLEKGDKVEKEEMQIAAGGEDISRDNVRPNGEGESLPRPNTASRHGREEQEPAAPPESNEETSLQDANEMCASGDAVRTPNEAVLVSIMRRITRDGHQLATLASGSFDRLCFGGQLSSSVNSSAVRDPTEFEDVRNVASDAAGHAKFIRDSVEEEKREKLEKIKRLSARYKSLKKQWKEKMRASRERRSKEKIELIHERDRYLLMAIRGTNMIPTSRTGSGRVTYKPSGANGASGAPSSLQEVDVMLTEMESAGGTAGDADRWKRTLAKLPDQEARRPPFDGGSVLIEDPLLEYCSSRSVNPWTREERHVFIDKFLVYNKNFKKIAEYLEYKSTQDVVRFYFQNKLCLNLKQLAKEHLKKKGGGARRAISMSRFRLDSRVNVSRADDYEEDCDDDD